MASLVADASLRHGNGGVQPSESPWAQGPSPAKTQPGLFSWSSLEQSLDEWDDLCSQLDNNWDTASSISSGSGATGTRPGSAVAVLAAAEQSGAGLQSLQSTLTTLTRMMARSQRAQALHGKATTLLARQVLGCLKGTQVDTLAKAVQDVKECADWSQQVHQLNTELKVQRYSWEQVHARLMDAQAQLQAREEELLARDQEVLLLRAELEAACSQQSSRAEGQRCVMEAREQEVQQLQADLRVKAQDLQRVQAELRGREQECARLRAVAAQAPVAGTGLQGERSGGGAGATGPSGPAALAGDAGAEEAWRVQLLQGLQALMALLPPAALHSSGSASEDVCAAVGRVDCWAQEPGWKAEGRTWAEGCLRRVVAGMEGMAVQAQGKPAAGGAPSAAAAPGKEGGKGKRDSELASALAEAQRQLDSALADATRLQADASSAASGRGGASASQHQQQPVISAEAAQKLAESQAQQEELARKLAEADARVKQLEVDLGAARKLEQSVQAALSSAWAQAEEARQGAAAAQERMAEGDKRLSEAERKLVEAEAQLAAMADAERKLATATAAERKLAAQLAAAQQEGARWAAAVGAAEARARAAEAAQASERELSASLRGRLEAAAEAHARQAREAEASKRELAEGMRERHAALQAKLEEAEQKLRLALQGQQTAEQTRQMETLDAELAAAREALTAERELSERLSEELGKTQSRLGAVQREKAALELDASLLSDRLAMNEDNLEAARQEAEDKASAALAEADNVRKELATAQAEAEALRRELAAMDGRLRDAVAAAAAAGSSVTGRLGGSRGRSVGTSPAPRGPSAGNAQGHPPSKEVGGLSDGGTASRGASSGGAAADTSTPARTAAVAGPGSTSASPEAEAAALCSAAVANDVPANGEAAQLREVRALLAATEQELQATQAKLRALSELAQAECVAVLANTGADASGEAGCQGGAADRQGVQALLATLRCCDVLHTKRSHGSNLASIRMMQAQLEDVLQGALLGGGSSAPPAILQEIDALQQLQRDQAQQQQQQQQQQAHTAQQLQQQPQAYQQDDAGHAGHAGQHAEDHGRWQDTANMALLEDLGSGGWGEGDGFGDGEGTGGGWGMQGAGGAGGGGWGDFSSEAGRSDVTALSSSVEGGEQPSRELSSGGLFVANGAGGGGAAGVGRAGYATDGGWDAARRRSAGGGTVEGRFGSGGGRRGGAVTDDVMAGLDAWDLPPITPPPKFD